MFIFCPSTSIQRLGQLSSRSDVSLHAILTSRESVALYMMSSQPLNIATSKSERYACPTWSKVMTEFSQDRPRSMQACLSGITSALATSPFSSTHYTQNETK